MRKILLLIIAVGVLIAIKLWFFPGRAQSKVSGKDQPGQPVGVSVYVVHQEEVTYDIYAGASLNPRESVELAAESAGRIRQILFKEGNRIEKGALLVKLNDDELQAQLRKQELGLKMSRERLGRLEKLLSVKGTSQEEFDLLQNETEMMEAEIQFIKAQIAKTEVRAPFGGIIGLRLISEGAVVQPGIPLLSLVQHNSLLLDFSVPERYASKVRPGMTVRFEVEGRKGPYTARIIATETRLEEGTRSLRVRAEYLNQEGELLPGMSAKVGLSLQSDQDALMIPTQAVIPILKGQKVFLIRQGRAKEVQIKTGLRMAERIEVEEGLAAGDTIITTGIMSLRNGTPVKALIEKHSGEGHP